MNIHYRPWVGDNYWSEKKKDIIDKRLLLLGESHYGDSKPEATVRYTQAYIDGENHRFWTSIMKLVLGKRVDKIGRREFWHAVSFYNYIQELVGEGPRDRPTHEMWENSAPAFLDVLNDLKPERIIVLGAALWNNLPSIWRQGPEIKSCGEPKDTRIYPYEGGEALATWVYHPSSLKGADTLSVHPCIKELMSIEF